MDLEYTGGPFIEVGGGIVKSQYIQIHRMQCADAKGFEASLRPSDFAGVEAPRTIWEIGWPRWML